MISAPSPNFEERKGVETPSLVILHYTGMKDGEEALARLRDPASKVSAHYLIEEDGRIFALVDEKYRAWHAGKSYWRGVTDINSHSIGIEIVNPGHEYGYRAFPEVQMQAVLKLCLEIKERYALPCYAFLAHSDVAPARKEDPGELFDWKRLARHGVGVWYEKIFDNNSGDVRQQLATIGYDALTCSDDELKFIIRAFQRHFVPHNLSGIVDSDTADILQRISHEALQLPV